MTEILPESTYRELLLWLLRKRKRFRVTGLSMTPLLQPGEEILVDLNAYQKAFPRVGEIVVAAHPYYSELHIIKRVMSVAENGSCFLQGDNLAESSDSRSFGIVAIDKILGRVTSRFA
ncbi:MAG: nickel-type superoxide dismutase maturation protease [Xenococcaceae cyanobacterium MO_188.B32]|nr:nickel-type superoxide dismutase maturation protease [Xenococcaceae cyanobacterium MO_188.B32]